MSDLTTAERCEQIVRKIVELANDDKPVTISRDWGGNSCTLVVDGAHTHCGCPDSATWDDLVREMRSTLHGGPGLSWIKP